MIVVIEARNTTEADRAVVKLLQAETKAVVALNKVDGLKVHDALVPQMATQDHERRAQQQRCERARSDDQRARRLRLVVGRQRLIGAATWLAVRAVSTG